MRVIATAPGRCGVLGNPTDMYGGSVLSCSLSERATAIWNPRMSSPSKRMAVPSRKSSGLPMTSNQKVTVWT
jgi:galactokinase